MSTLIRGSGGGGKGGGGGTRVAQEAPDSLRSRAFAKVIDLVSEGEIEGLVDGLKSVYLDDTPIQNTDGSYNFSGVEIHTRNGSQAQAYIPGFSAIENEVVVNTQVKANQPVTRTISDTDIDAVRIKVSVPQLTFQNTTNGDLSGTEVELAIDIQTNGAGFVQALTDKISGKTTSRYQRDYYVALPGSGPWEIRVRRLTEDSTKANIQNNTYVDSYTEIIESKLRYPNSALVALRVDSAQFSSIPRRSYDMRLLRIRVPSNYNPVNRTYSGAWSGGFKVAWSDNPAWVLYDLLTNPRYGLGGYIPENQVDKWSLYTISKYCDELVPNGFGGSEPRFTCNAYLQTQAEAYRLMQDLASVFRGMVYWSSGAITVTQDAPGDPVALFTTANVVEGAFHYSGASLRSRHTVALVTWNDPDDYYRQKVEYVEDAEGIARFGVIQTQVTAFGCTSRGQANRVGRWLLYSERSESETVTFKTGLEGAVARPGHIIKVADSVRGGERLGGRVASATLTAITIDADIERSLGGWTLSVMLPSGQIETRTIGSKTGRVLQPTLAFTEAPLADAIWVVSSTQVEAQLFRVIAVAEDGDGQFTVTALAHNPSKYEAIERGLKLQERDISLLSLTPPAPLGLKVTESLYRVKNEAFVLIQIGWEQVFGAIEYQVSYRVNGGNTINLPKTAANYTEIREAESGDYVFTVRAVGATNKLGSVATVAKTIVGKLAPPEDVQAFVIYRRPTDLVLTWQANTDADLAGYEVRVGSGWDSATLVGRTDGTQLVHDQSESGVYNYHLRAFDTSGKYSTNVTTFVLNLTAPSAVRQFDVIQSANRLEFRWLPNPEPEVIAYELREGAAWDTSVFVAEVKSTSYTLPAGFEGVRTFWIKAIASPGIYADIPMFVTTEVAQPQNANLLIRQDEVERGFPGIRHFADVDSVESIPVLRMQSGARRSEYIFEIDIGTRIRAQNTLLTGIGASQDDRETWAMASYAWNSPDANRQWTYDGAVKNIQARFQVAKEDGLLDGEVHGWRLNGTLAGLGGVSVAEQVGASVYAAGRYGSGLKVVDTTQVAWSVAIPETFHTSFWYIPDQVTTCIAWRATGSAGAILQVGFDAQKSRFFLEDGLGDEIVVPFAFAAGERLCIGICQTSTHRRLFVGAMGGEIHSAQAELPPQGGYTSLRLY
jgi:predicted phage tail protein